jgi:hypothetical protein
MLSLFLGANYSSHSFVANGSSIANGFALGCCALGWRICTRFRFLPTALQKDWGCVRKSPVRRPLRPSYLARVGKRRSRLVEQLHGYACQRQSAQVDEQSCLQLIQVLVLVTYSNTKKSGKPTCTAVSAQLLFCARSGTRLATYQWQQPRRRRLVP